MPAETFLARRSKLASEIEGLQSLARLLPDSAEVKEPVFGALRNLFRRCQTPIILAFAGPPIEEKKWLFERAFSSKISAAKPRRAGSIRIIKHQAAPPEEGMPDGAEEFFINAPELEGFVLLDLDENDDATESAGLHARLLLQADAVFFCFDAEDPWHPPTWSLIQASIGGISDRAAVLLLDAASIEPGERAERERHFQQIASKKFSATLPIFEVDTRNNDDSALREALGFVDKILVPGHRRADDLAAAAGELSLLSMGIERGLREAAGALRDEEFKLVELERKLLSQHNWLRLQIDASVSALISASNAALERASELFENETSPARMHNIFARLNRTARDLQEGVGEALRKLLTPRLEAVAVGLEEQLYSGWLAAAEASAPSVAGRIREALKAGPRLEELRQICRTRMDLHLGTGISGKEMEEIAGRLISQSCSSLLLPFVILGAAVAAGLAAAFQVGCELAGGAVIGLGLLGAIWAAISGFNIRKILAKQYRQTLAFRTQHAIRLMQEEVRTFGSSLLDEIGRRVTEAADDLAASRKFLDPAIAEAAARANALTGADAATSNTHAQTTEKPRP